MIATALAALITANPDADAAALLSLAQADARTVTPIALSVLNPYLSSRGLTARLSRSADAIASANQAGSDQLKSFLAFVQSSANPTFDTTNTEYAASANTLFTAMIGLNGQSATLGVTQDEAAAIIAMGGGYLTKDATADDVAAAVAKITRDAAYAAMQSLASADAAEANSLYQQRMWKIMAGVTAGTDAPATLADLDAMGA